MLVNLSLYHSFDFGYCISVCAYFTIFSFFCKLLAHFGFVSLGCVNLNQGLLVVDKNFKFIFATVTYISIYKSTLVSELNGNNFISKDQLTRVRNSIYSNNADNYTTTSYSISLMMLGFGSDCGVFFV